MIFCSKNKCLWQELPRSFSLYQVSWDDLKYELPETGIDLAFLMIVQT